MAEANFTLKDFSEFSRKALKHGSAPGNNYRSLAEAWAWVEPAFKAMLTATGAPKLEFAAVAHITTLVNAPPGIARLTAADLEDWIEKLLLVYKSDTRDNRIHMMQAPSLNAGIVTLKDNFQYKCLKSSLQAGPSGLVSSPATQSSGRSKSGKAPAQPKQQAASSSGASGQSANRSVAKAQAKPTAMSKPASASGWPERTRNLPDAKFTELKSACQAKYPDSCVFFMIAKCSRAACSRKHERPVDFESFLGSHGLKINGEVSNPHRAKARASQPPHAGARGGLCEPERGVDVDALQGADRVAASLGGGAAGEVDDNVHGGERRRPVDRRRSDVAHRMRGHGGRHRPAPEAHGGGYRPASGVGFAHEGGADETREDAAVTAALRFLPRAQFNGADGAGDDRAEPGGVESTHRAAGHTDRDPRNHRGLPP